LHDEAAFKRLFTILVEKWFESRRTLIEQEKICRKSLSLRKPTGGAEKSSGEIEKAVILVML